MILFRRRSTLRKSFLFTLVIYVVHIVFLGLLIFAMLNRNTLQQGKNSHSKIHIGTIACSGSAYFNSPSNLPTESEAEALTLIKSIFISAISYNVTQSIEMSIFTDTYHFKNRIETAAQEYQSIINGRVNIELNYYSAYQLLPEGYEKIIVDGNLENHRPPPCGLVGLFFPDSLPEDTKHILLLDTDVVITGNISRIWEKMVETVNSENGESSNPTEAFAVMALNTEPSDDHHVDLYKRLFADIPHVAPTGTNAGVIFMNLEAMRRFNWTDMVMRVYFEYRAAQLSDQKLLNILFHENPDRLKLISCQYNFMHGHCDITLSCEAAAEDADGIQILHGSGSRFSGSLKKAHNLIYQAYKQFDLGNYNEIEKHLYAPLKRQNNLSRGSNSMDMNWDNCRGSVGPLLYTKLNL